MASCWSKKRSIYHSTISSDPHFLGVFYSTNSCHFEASNPRSTRSKISSAPRNAEYLINEPGKSLQKLQTINYELKTPSSTRTRRTSYSSLNFLATSTQQICNSNQFPINTTHFQVFCLAPKFLRYSDSPLLLLICSLFTT